MKVVMPIEDLCAGLPQEFTLYFKYVKGLEFQETPDYTYLKQMFVNCVHNLKK